MVRDVWVSDENGELLVFTTKGNLLRYVRYLAERQSENKALFNMDGERLSEKYIRERLDHAQMTFYSISIKERTSESWSEITHEAHLAMVTPAWLITQRERPQEIFEM